MTEITRIETVPWRPRSYVRGNLAISNLSENLIQALTNEQGIHPETLLVAIGTIVGAAAQNAVLDEVRRDPQLEKMIKVTDTESGDKYLFSDLLNAHLAPHAGLERFTLWPVLEEAALQCGVPSGQLPHFEPMFTGVANAIGKPEFGYPDVPADHRPAFGARDAMNALWPFARDVLLQPPPPGVAEDEPLLTVQHWPAIAAVVSARLLKQSKDVLDPRLGVVLVMEPAIAASKLPLPDVRPGPHAGMVT